MQTKHKKNIFSLLPDFVYQVFGVRGQRSEVRGSPRRGFTLVEMIVSLGLFTIILFIATSAFLTIVNADRKSRAVRIATDNLNLALEDMQRRIKTGTNYFCGSGGEGSLTAVQDCDLNNLGTEFSFTEQDGVTRTTYSWGPIGAVPNGTPPSIYRYQNGGVPVLVTAPEIVINDLKFRVSGSMVGTLPTGDSIQSYALIVIRGAMGASGVNPAGKVDFNIQTKVTQRSHDS